MPIYEYECGNCGKRFEKIQSIMAEPLEECVLCGGGPIKRVMQPVGIIFKGSGWYINDSRKSGGSEGGSAAKDAKGEGSDSKGEGSKSEGSKNEGSKGEGSKNKGSKSDAGGGESSSSKESSTTTPPTD
jgi:putative FmdB family regulatory protein